MEHKPISEINAKIEEIRQWSYTASYQTVKWLCDQLQAEQQKNASPENESWKKRETLDKFADYCIQRNVMLAENKTLREAINFEIDALMLVRDRQGGRASIEDINKGIGLLRAALAKDGD